MTQATDAAIGMMDGAYFTSRKEILDFFNTLLDLNITKIEQTASGAVACQLTEYLFPNSVPMSRVDWGAKASHEYIANYKLLQSAFDKHSIRKHVDVDKLIRGKYQDNLEFCQWLKAFFDQTTSLTQHGREGYDPVAVRAKGKGGKHVERRKGGNAFEPKKTLPTSQGKISSHSDTSSTQRGATARNVTGASRINPSASTTSSRPRSSTSSVSTVSTSRVHKENIPNTSSSVGMASSPEPLKNSNQQDDILHANRILKEENRRVKAQISDLQSKYTELEQTSAEIEMTLQNVESERDFYFEKLRGIEIMLQVYKEKEEEGKSDYCPAESAIDFGEEARMVIEKVFKVMYATAEDNVEVDDEGNLIGDIDLKPSNQVEREFDVEDEEELLTSEIKTPVNTFYAPVESGHLRELSDDDSDDAELLTEGLNDYIDASRMNESNNSMQKNSSLDPKDNSVDAKNIMISTDCGTMDSLSAPTLKDTLNLSFGDKLEDDDLLIDGLDEAYSGEEMDDTSITLQGKSFVLEPNDGDPDVEISLSH